jgi:cyclopropane fatty-acyl-phospholipid synthase-like methyltransferase
MLAEMVRVADTITVTEGNYTLCLQSQMRKLDMIIEAAGIKAGDHVLEIGCGWGAFAIRAVQTRGCRVTG